VAIETPSGTVNGVNVTFTSLNTLPFDHQLFVDRALQIPDTDYTYTGSTITFLSGSIPQTGALLRLYTGVTGLPASGNSGTDAFETVATIISDTAIELGLVTAAIADPFASTDANILRLNALLKARGRELAKAFGWSHLQKECTFLTANGQAAYDLPDDFLSMADQSQWNRSSTLPLAGPASQQIWQQLKGQSISVSINTIFRPVNGQVMLYPTPSAIETVAFEYLSRWWVRPFGQDLPTTDTPSAATDTVCFEPLLMVRALKVAWKEATGFDATAARNDYESTLQRCMADDSTGGVLELSPRRTFRLINAMNAPDTGYGS
jgi:hypothetical protein